MGVSAIEWTEQTWNPVVGCSILTPGCTNCYAMRDAWRKHHIKALPHYHGLTKKVKGNPVWTGKLAMAPDSILLAPLKRKKPTLYFVNSMGDLFHEDCPAEWIDRVFAVMALSPQHTFQVLTKRAARMREYCTSVGRADALARANAMLIAGFDSAACARLGVTSNGKRLLPLPNVWLGVSCERQQEADERIPLLLQTPAAVRFISAEPLLGPIDLRWLPHVDDDEESDGVIDALIGRDWIAGIDERYGEPFSPTRPGHADRQMTRQFVGEKRGRLDWVIAGGESGPKARPMHPDWPRALRDQCKAAGVAFHFKQWGEWAPHRVVPGDDLGGAAALRGFESVPCVIIAATEAEQADAFVAINANVTAMSPLQLHAARLAAGDKNAVALAEVCSAAGVTICRYPIPSNAIKAGETLAVATLQGLLNQYGRELLIAALSSITKTRKGNPGLIQKPIIQALCTALTPEWTEDLKRLVFAMQSFDFSAKFNAARGASIDSGKKVATILAGMIGEHLNQAPPAAPVEAKPAPATSTGAPAAPPKPAAPVRAGMLSIGRDTVSFRGQVKVAPRAALLVAALAKAKPSFVGDAFLISKIWNVRPQNSGELMDALVSDLACLKTIGLEVRTQRGLGRQLVELPA